MAVHVGRADVVAHRQHAGDADRDVRLAVPPRAAEGVGHDHRDLDAEALARSDAHDLAGGVGIDGEQRDEVFAADVGGVDAGVGALEAVPRLRDQHPADLPDHARRLAQHRLHQAGVLIHAAGVVEREGAWLEVVEGDDAPLRLGDDALRDHDDVAVLDRRALRRGGVEDLLRDVVALLDERDPGDADDAELGDAGVRRGGHDVPSTVSERAGRPTMRMLVRAL